MPVDPILLGIIDRAIYIGENCEIGSFVDQISSTFTTFRAINNFTNIQIIGSIPLAFLQAGSNDMNYGVYNNSLYRYNPISFQYDNVMTFPPY